jgi:predicted SprT family Zn-dependent metalloprotease
MSKPEANELARGNALMIVTEQGKGEAVTIARAEELIRAEMEKFGMFERGWTYGIEETRYRFGVADFKKKQIRISAPCILVNSEAELIETVRHEIAHVNAGLEAGHGRLWKLQAIAVGAKPEACCGQNVVSPDMKYHAICPLCSHRFTRSRLPTTKDKRTNERKPYAGSCGYCAPSWYRTQERLDKCRLQWIETATGEAIQWPPLVAAAPVEVEAAPVEVAPSPQPEPEPEVWTATPMTNAVQQSLF